MRAPTTLLLAAVALAFLRGVSSSATPEPPNIVVLLAWSNKDGRGRVVDE